MHFRQTMKKIACLGGDDPIEAVFLWICALIWIPFMVSGTVMLLMSIAFLAIPSVRKKILRDRTTAALILSIGILSVVSALLYRNTIGVIVGIAVPLTFVMWFFMKTYANRRIFEKCSVILGLGLLVSTVWAALDYYPVSRDYPDYRPAAGAFNPNYFGAIAALTVAVMAIRLFERRTDERAGETSFVWEKIFFAAMIPVGVVAIGFAGSRSAFLSAVVAGMVLGAMTPPKKITIPIVLLGAAVLVWAWSDPRFLNRSNSIVSTLTEIRVPIWKETLRSWVQDARSILIGRGPLTARIAVYSEDWNVETKEGVAHAHNLLLDGLLNVGIIGTALYSVVIYRLVKPVMTLGRTKASRFAFSLGVAAIAECVVGGLVDVTLIWHQTALLFFFMLSFAAALVKDENAPEAQK